MRLPPPGQRQRWDIDAVTSHAEPAHFPKKAPRPGLFRLRRDSGGQPGLWGQPGLGGFFFFFFFFFFFRGGQPWAEAGRWDDAAVSPEEPLRSRITRKSSARLRSRSVRPRFGVRPVCQRKRAPRGRCAGRARPLAPAGPDEAAGQPDLAAKAGVIHWGEPLARFRWTESARPIPGICLSASRRGRRGRCKRCYQPGNDVEAVSQGAERCWAGQAARDSGRVPAGESLDGGGEALGGDVAAEGVKVDVTSACGTAIRPGASGQGPAGLDRLAGDAAPAPPGL